MGKIKMFAYVSIDGYMTRTDGDIDWILEFEDSGKTDYGLKDFFDAIDTVVMNQNHYRILLGYDLCASCMSKPTVMISTNLDYKIAGNYDVEYVISEPEGYGEAVEFLQNRKAADRGDMLLAGDHRLIHALLGSGLVDEITVTMLPVSLGGGVRLLPAGFRESDWRKSNVRDYQNGAVQMTYRVVGPS